MLKRHIVILIVIVCHLSLLVSCAPQRPVLYPNNHLKDVGDESAQADIDECMRMAENYGAKENAGGKVAKDAATSAVVGAVAGAAISAVFGGDIGRAAAAGAVGGGAASGTRSALDSGKHDPVFKKFVERCLREKGYETVGWR